MKQMTSISTFNLNWIPQYLFISISFILKKITNEDIEEHFDLLTEDKEENGKQNESESDTSESGIPYFYSG